MHGTIIWHESLPLNFGKKQNWLPLHDVTIIIIMNLLKILLSISIVLSPTPLCAWSEGGHHIITLLAFDLLEPGEKSQLLSILDKHPRFAEDFAPPSNLPNENEATRWRVGRIGYWPDIARRQPTFHRSTWHYELGHSLVIGEASTMKVPTRPGPLPSNATLQTQELYISQALGLCTKVLADSSQPDSDRAVALCWIAHLVADAHQPCHAGSLYMEKVFVEQDGDRGANSILTKQKKNMHALWDQYAAMNGVILTDDGPFKAKD